MQYPPHLPPAAGRAPRAAVTALARGLALAALLAAGSPALSAAPPAPDADPAHFRYQPLPAEGAVDFVIDASSPTFEFQSGPSAFRAFALPPQTHPYVVEVRSFLEGGPDPRRARVLYPVVAVLTDDFLVSRSTDLEFLRFDLPLFEHTTAPAYRVTLPIDPSATRERYLVVFTPARLAAGRSLPPITNPDSAAEAARFAFLGASPYGKLRITLRAGEARTAASQPAAEPPGP
ncbi:MAG TPA: hypothetical protein VN790_01575 [Steroidobacteraceae bacterium]|nr:hypothetical protein [Steroidobacteraceae bacterium]